VWKGPPGSFHSGSVVLPDTGVGTGGIISPGRTDRSITRINNSNNRLITSE
jgi:hypothetical protein